MAEAESLNFDDETSIGMEENIDGKKKLKQKKKISCQKLRKVTWLVSELRILGQLMKKKLLNWLILRTNNFTLQTLPPSVTRGSDEGWRSNK